VSLILANKFTGLNLYIDKNHDKLGLLFFLSTNSIQFTFSTGKINGDFSAIFDGSGRFLRLHVISDQSDIRGNCLKKRLFFTENVTKTTIKDLFFD